MNIRARSKVSPTTRFDRISQLRQACSRTTYGKGSRTAASPPAWLRRVRRPPTHPHPRRRAQSPAVSLRSHDADRRREDALANGRQRRRQGVQRQRGLREEARRRRGPERALQGPPACARAPVDLRLTPLRPLRTDQGLHGYAALTTTAVATVVATTHPDPALPAALPAIAATAIAATTLAASTLATASPAAARTPHHHPWFWHLFAHAQRPPSPQVSRPASPCLFGRRSWREAPRAQSPRPSPTPQT